MAPCLLYDLSKLDLKKQEFSLDDIRKINPQRFEMEQLSAIIHIDYPAATVVGVKHVDEKEFWARGHIPGRPLMPGVMMVEAAAQLCAFMARKVVPEIHFMGFTKADNVRFRGTVVPPASLYLIAQAVDISRRRIIANCQGICNGALVFEAMITGMPV
ncbi:MAG: 3-hydroxyacyl-ACP dehydratase FabZ family protein [Phycisphaerae bacterium]